jgi:ornithine--oxo-acid transaminase
MSSAVPERRRFRLLGYACGAGAADWRCEQGPDALRAGGLAFRLAGRGLDVAWEEPLLARPCHADCIAESLAELCDRLSRRVAQVLARGARPVVIGGDHTCAIGTWRGLGRALGAPPGLIWIDAHMDAHTPESSPSGAWHGMPLACLLGRGRAPLADGDAALDAGRLALVGVRSFERAEAQLLQHLGARVFSMAEVRHRGLQQVMAEALALVTGGTGGFGISIDVDALDPRDAPGTGTPVPGGIRVEELGRALAEAARHPAFRALEIAEFNPALDQDGVTLDAVEVLLAAAMSGEVAAPRAPRWEQRYGARNYDPLPVVLVKGEGPWLWDDQGRRYLDMMGAYSAVSHGHCHPRITRVLGAQAQTLAVTSRAFHNDRLPRFLKRLCELTGQDRALPVNTGLEAVETALKAARKWAYRVKGIAPDRAEIICCEGNFHGRSIAILAMSSEPGYRDGFGPYPPGFVPIPFADAAALERAITPRTAAFLVEPIQGEGGIVVPPPGYLAACAGICRRHNVLLICDEVQTGLGRTGRFLACEHEGVKPDGLVLGKALGGGVLPVSAFLAREDVMGVFTPGDHGSTFGGNPLAAAVGLEALNVLVEERLPQRAAELGQYFIQGLRAIRSPLVREVRGRGLLIGVEVEPRLASARGLCERLMAHGVLTKDTHETVVRLCPPLVIERAEIDEALLAIRASFGAPENLSRRAA